LLRSSTWFRLGEDVVELVNGHCVEVKRTRTDAIRTGKYKIRTKIQDANDSSRKSASIDDGESQRLAIVKIITNAHLLASFTTVAKGILDNIPPLIDRDFYIYRQKLRLLYHVLEIRNNVSLGISRRRW
jgi:hypothetical protein